MMKIRNFKKTKKKKQIKKKITMKIIIKKNKTNTQD